MSISLAFDLLIAAICLAVILQPSIDRFVIAILYALMCVGHHVACENFEGFWYFFSAGVFDLAIVAIVCAYNGKTRLTGDIINVSIASIVLNAYGWLTWFNYQSLLSYQLTMVALYFIAILSLLRKDCADGSQPHRWYSGIRLLVSKSVAFCHPKQKAAGT